MLKIQVYCFVTTQGSLESCNSQLPASSKDLAAIRDSSLGYMGLNRRPISISSLWLTAVQNRLIGSNELQVAQAK
ncbi:hypothetical protein B0H12DRAFT_1132672, partial [Mycena haematopus]